MNPSISFGGTNSGLQIGTNHGSINSQIHIQNITTIRPLANSIYKSLFSASDQFDQVRNELGLLISVLNATEEHTPEFRPGDPRIDELNDALNGCRDVLQDLQRLKEHFDDVGPQTQVTWERMGWGVEELAEIRGKFSLQIQALNLLNTAMLRSSHQNVERILMTFIGEIQCGKRESAAMSSASASSLSMDEREAWRILRKELQGIGITPGLFMKHREFILYTLQTHLKENEIEGPPSLDTSALHHRSQPEMRDSFFKVELESYENRNQILKTPSPDMFRVLYIGLPNSQTYIFDNNGKVILERSLGRSLLSPAETPRFTVIPNRWQRAHTFTLAELLPDNVRLVVDEFERITAEFKMFVLHFKNRPSCSSRWNGYQYSISSGSKWTLPNIAVLYVPDANTPSLLETESSLSDFLERHGIPVVVFSDPPDYPWLGIKG